MPRDDRGRSRAVPRLVRGESRRTSPALRQPILRPPVAGPRARIMNTLIIGSRGSALALAQVEIVRGLMAKAHPGLPVATKIIKTTGDQFHNLSLTTGGGKGLFTKE